MVSFSVGREARGATAHLQPSPELCTAHDTLSACEEVKALYVGSSSISQPYQNFNSYCLRWLQKLKSLHAWVAAINVNLPWSLGLYCFVSDTRQQLPCCLPEADHGSKLKTSANSLRKRSIVLNHGLSRYRAAACDSSTDSESFPLNESAITTAVWICPLYLATGKIFTKSYTSISHPKGSWEEDYLVCPSPSARRERA